MAVRAIWRILAVAQSTVRYSACCQMLVRPSVLGHAGAKVDLPLWKWEDLLPARLEVFQEHVEEPSRLVGVLGMPAAGSVQMGNKSYILLAWGEMSSMGSMVKKCTSSTLECKRRRPTWVMRSRTLATVGFSAHRAPRIHRTR